MYRISLIAPPGGGKGTQAELICAKLKIPHLSTGEVFRDIIKGEYAGKYPVKKILPFMKNGKLVPDDIVVDVLKDQLNYIDKKNGFLLDGFPRNIHQAELFDFKNYDKINTVVFMNVEEQLLLKRLTGRRICPECGKIYNVYYSPSRDGDKCENDGFVLSMRDDDQENTVKERLKVYHQETEPLVRYYNELGVLRNIDGGMDKDKVFTQIMEVIEA